MKFSCGRPELLGYIHPCQYLDFRPQHRKRRHQPGGHLFPARLRGVNAGRVRSRGGKQRPGVESRGRRGQEEALTRCDLQAGVDLFHLKRKRVLLPSILAAMPRWTSLFVTVSGRRRSRKQFSGTDFAKFGVDMRRSTSYSHARSLRAIKSGA
jgi:hypothetical protein